MENMKEDDKICLMKFANTFSFCTWEEKMQLYTVLKAAFMWGMGTGAKKTAENGDEENPAGGADIAAVC